MATELDLSLASSNPHLRPPPRIRRQHHPLFPPLCTNPLRLKPPHTHLPFSQTNLIFRSGDLSHLPPTSLARLKDDCKITTIFDLRYEKERERQPTPEIAGVENIWLSTIRDLDSLDSADGFIAMPIRKLPSIKMPDDFVANEGVDGFVDVWNYIRDA
jgi:hypothetical protein